MRPNDVPILLHIGAFVYSITVFDIASSAISAACKITSLITERLFDHCCLVQIYLDNTISQIDWCINAMVMVQFMCFAEDL